MPDLKRRIFLTVSSGAALMPTLPPASAAPTPASTTPAAPPPYRFFNAEEAAFMEAAVQRLIPPDEIGPSAMEAGVVNFIDGQLAGAWGAGERLYRSGPWLPGLPTQGYQLPLTPAQLFRTALRAVRDDLARRQQPAFEQMAGPAQDAYLTALQNGSIELDGVPSKVFFESLLAMTVEGYFGDPAYGGNRGMAAWQMIGFPGAHGAYYNWIDRHGERFDGPPRSLAESGGHVHAMPGAAPTQPRR